MAPIFEFDNGHHIETGGPVFVNPAGGELDGEFDDTDVFLPRRTSRKVVEYITDAAETLRSVSLKKRESPAHLIVDGAEKLSVVIPLGHNVIVHTG